MHYTIRIFLNVILIFFLLFSLVIAYSEYSPSVNKKISIAVKKELDNTLGVETNIGTITFKWIGLSPRVHIQNVSMEDNNKNTVLVIPSSELHINLYQTLEQQAISVDKIIINNTELNLKYKNDEVFFNKRSLSEQVNKNTKRPVSKLILNNTKIKLTDVTNTKSFTFQANSLIASYIDNLLRIQTNFTHESSPDPITVLYESDLVDTDTKSKLYISGNSIKIPYFLLPNQIHNLKSDQVSMRIWISMLNQKIVRASGNIATDKLSINLGHSEFNVQDINSDLLYLNDENGETVSLMRMNYILNTERVSNNKIVLNKVRNESMKIFIKKSDNRFLNGVIKSLNVDRTELIGQLSSSIIENMQIHLSENGNLRYFSLSANDISINLQGKYSIDDIDVDVFGTLKKGLFTIRKLTVKENQNALVTNVSGTMAYSLKGKSLYFSSSELSNDQGHNISIVGSKTSRLPTIKIMFSSELKKIIPYIYGEMSDKYEYGGGIKGGIYFHTGRIFAKSTLTDVFVSKLDTLYVSSPNINLSTSSKFIHSKKFNLFINEEKFKSRIITNSNSESHKFIISSIGFFDVNKLDRLLETKGAVQGKTRIKSLLTYNYNSGKLSSYITSDLDGIAIKIMKPFNKTSNQKTNFTLNYQHYPTKKYPVSFSLGKHEFKLRNDEEYIYTNIKSPVARGFLKMPYKSDINNEASGSFEFIDTRYFESKGMSKSFPRINVKSKHVKTKDVVLDNVHVILTPKDEFIAIDKLKFENLFLSMNASGKWYRKNEEKTELVADIQSTNFGQALAAFGYPNLLKGGVMNAKLKGSWSGSIENFKFSSTQGNLNFTITDGQINELDKGTQAIGQVLGLFSISAIPKRLSLDFSDFFSKGLRFDSLSSEIKLKRGLADTEKMIIIGSFGEMRLTGESNLISKTHDQTLIFIPDLSSTSLVTGAVLGGPIGAAASIFYDKLLKEFGLDTNKLAGIEYSIKGPWQNPEIKVTQSFKPILN